MQAISSSVFTIVGLLLFGLPRLVTVTTPVLAAYVLSITYLIVPLQNILERLPTLFSASVAVQKVERIKQHDSASYFPALLSARVVFHSRSKQMGLSDSRYFFVM